MTKRELAKAILSGKLLDRDVIKAANDLAELILLEDKVKERKDDLFENIKK